MALSSLKRKRWVGTFKTLGEAREAERDAAWSVCGAGAAGRDRSARAAPPPRRAPTGRLRVYALREHAAGDQQPAGALVDVFARREDAERLLDHLQRDEPPRASSLHITEHELVPPEARDQARLGRYPSHGGSGGVSHGGLHAFGGLQIDAAVRKIARRDPV